MSTSLILILCPGSTSFEKKKPQLAFWWSVPYGVPSAVWQVRLALRRLLATAQRQLVFLARQELLLGEKYLSERISYFSPIGFIALWPQVAHLTMTTLSGYHVQMMAWPHRTPFQYQVKQLKFGDVDDVVPLNSTSVIQRYPWRDWQLACVCYFVLWTWTALASNHKLFMTSGW